MSELCTKINTPLFSHLSSKDFLQIYEPSEDSFLFIDSLEKELPFIQHVYPKLVLEVGCGSGIVITALATALGEGVTYMATDINSKACLATEQTGRLNGVKINCVCTDLVRDVIEEIEGKVDILIFNPPYVVTPSEEIGQGELEYTWAGGRQGREVMDKLLLAANRLLSLNGVFYLVAEKRNNIDQIGMLMKKINFCTNVVMDRKAGIEHLYVLKFSRI